MLLDRVRRVTAVGAAVDVGPHAPRDDQAVVGHAVGHVDPHAIAGRRDDHLLLAAVDVLGRAGRSCRRRRCQRLDHGVDLAAKAAAHRPADETEAAGGDLQDVGCQVE